MITVKNLRGNKKLEPGDVYIGRYCKHRPDLVESVLANPYPIEPSKRTREQSVSLYREWIYEQLKDGKNDKNPVIQELDRLVRLAAQGDLGLACWCSPQICHGDIVKEIIETW